MEKSRQRRYPTVKSNLNILREVFISAFSLLLWMYSTVALMTISFTLLNLDTYYVQLSRTILNVDPADIEFIFTVVVIGAAVSFVYLLATYFANLARVTSK